MILLTGFEPWGDEIYNSSWEILVNQKEYLMDTFDCEIHQLPVSWNDVASKQSELIERISPTVVVHFGMCGGTEILCETVARNRSNKTIVDNYGVYSPREAIIEYGDSELLSLLPCEDIVKSLQDAQIPASLSDNAGEYLCNFTFYHLMNIIKNRQSGIQAGGFIHVPHFSSEGGMEKELLYKSVGFILQSLGKEIV